MSTWENLSSSKNWAQSHVGRKLRADERAGPLVQTASQNASPPGARLLVALEPAQVFLYLQGQGGQLGSTTLSVIFQSSKCWHLEVYQIPGLHSSPGWELPFLFNWWETQFKSPSIAAVAALPFFLLPPASPITALYKGRRQTRRAVRRVKDLGG